MDFRDYSLKELVSNVQGKKISAKELTQSALDNIDNVYNTNLTLPTTPNVKISVLAVS